MKNKFLLFVSLPVFLAASLSFAQNTSLQKVSFLPHWVPQAQFAGYYVAYEKGIYRKYGLDVTIVPGGPDVQVERMLKEGTVDFASMWLASAIKENEGTPKLVNIAQVTPKSALMLIAKKSSGIKTPQDINNKKVGLWEGIFKIQPLAFFKKYNLEVKIVPQSYSINLFLRDGVDVASVMWYNEYHAILNAGYESDELNTFFYSDYGLNLPEDGVYVLKDFFEKNPQLCRAFVKASLEGWLYAFKHPEEAVDIILKYMKAAHIPANRDHQNWMLARMKDLMMDERSGEPAWRLSESDYGAVTNLLKESGLVTSVSDYKDFYKDCL